MVFSQDAEILKMNPRTEIFRIGLQREQTIESLGRKCLGLLFHFIKKNCHPSKNLIFGYNTLREFLTDKSTISYKRGDH